MKTRRIQGMLTLVGVLLSAGMAFPGQDPARDDASAAVAGEQPEAAGPAVKRFEPQGAVVFDNGPLITHPTGGAGGLGASALQTNLTMNTFGFTSSVAGALRTADDFTVPAGETWRIDSVVLYAYQTNAPASGPSPLVSTNVQIWNGVPNGAGSTVVFGDTTTNRLVSSTFSSIYRVTDTTLTNSARAIWASTVSLGVDLPAGTYWVDFQIGGSAALAGPFVPPVTILGQTSTGNSMQKAGAAAWIALNDTGTNTPQGLPFLLQGLGPAGLAVSGGNANLVWEPAETVDIQTSWQGGGVAAANVTGTAVSDGQFTLTDSTASYGTIPAQTVVSCTAGTNCYAGTADGTRPDTHWDVVMTETLSTGHTKAWTLHIGSSFSDVPLTNGFYRFIETLLHKGVTGGCGAGIYCPGDSTSREQMAAFVLVAKEGAGYSPAACTTPMFADVPASNPFCPFIEELARRTVVTGCGGGNYCPGNAVTRDTMAVFALRTLDPALNPPACTTPMFADVPASNPFCRWIEELARRGVVTGCGGGNYCPLNPVTREQMGVFLTATFGLTLYGV